MGKLNKLLIFTNPLTYICGIPLGIGLLLGTIIYRTTKNIHRDLKTVTKDFEL